MVDTGASQQDIFANIEMGLGAWAWGDQLVWGYGRAYSLADVREVFEYSVANGVNLFDTAEVYGQGQSETILGELIKTSAQPVEVATKFMPFPWRLSRQSLAKALKGSLERLGLGQVLLYQIHQPLPPVTVETWMDAMAEALQAGLIRSVGVSNYSSEQMLRAHERLLREGAPLASNQVEYSLLSREVEKNGMLKLCQDEGIKLIAYSPLCMGVLTGKYNAENPPGGFRGARYGRRFLKKVEPLLKLMGDIGAEHGGRTLAQVAINWVICKGALPIPGAKNLRQAEQNIGALGWRLTPAEMARLDEMSDWVTLP